MRRIQEHLRDLQSDPAFNRTPDALGASKEGVYSDAARSMTLDVSDTLAKITVHDIRARQRYYGGPIATVNVSALAIPAKAEYYGSSPGNNGGRAAFALGKALNEKGYWQWALFAMDRSKRLRGRKGRTADALAADAERQLAYWLIPHGVNQPPDERVMPDDEVLRDTALNAAEGWMQRHVIAD